MANVVKVGDALCPECSSIRAARAAEEEGRCAGIGQWLRWSWPVAGTLAFETERACVDCGSLTYGRAVRW